MTNTPDERPVLRGPGIPVGPLDWRTAGFVAVRRAKFPEGDPVAHRVVKWYEDEPVNRVSGNWAASDLMIRPACADEADPDDGYVEMTPLYAQSRGAVWCMDPRCLGEVAE